MTAGVGVDRWEHRTGIARNQHRPRQAKGEARLDRRLDQHRERDPGRGQTIGHQRHRAIGEGGEGGDRQRVEGEAQECKERANEAAVAAPGRQSRRRPRQDPAQDRFAGDRRREDEGERDSGVDPALPLRRIFDLLTGPAVKVRRIEDQCGAGQNFIGRSIDPPPKSIEYGRRSRRRRRLSSAPANPRLARRRSAPATRPRAAPAPPDPAARRPAGRVRPARAVPAAARRPATPRGGARRRRSIAAAAARGQAAGAATLATRTMIFVAGGALPWSTPQSTERSRISRATPKASASPRASRAATIRGRSPAGRFWLSLYLPSSRSTAMSRPTMPFSIRCR